MAGQLWVSAEDGRQDPGKPIKSHGKLGVEYVLPDVLAAQADVSAHHHLSHPLTHRGLCAELLVALLGGRGGRWTW